MKVNKFIVQRDTIKMGVVTYHRDLRTNHESNILGGGSFDIDWEANTVLFFGYSTEFGNVTYSKMREIRIEGRYPKSLDNFIWKYSIKGKLEEALIDNVEI